MKLKLFDFQTDALHALREKLSDAMNLAAITKPQAISFSAPTGSGKTIIMTALFEALLLEPDEQLAWPADWVPQHDATILWVSDMPSLNEQTKLKIEGKSDRLKVRQLVTIDSTFDAERLEGGHIYFVNTQKLGEAGLLTKLGDHRKFSIWETFTNTASANPKSFVVVIDEAHRGMTSARVATEAQTLMQRFLLGYRDVGLVPMPLVIGVSATPKRFIDLLESDRAAHTLHRVSIPIDDVRKSGLLKDRILIDHPEISTKSEIALLEEAARRWDKMTAAWGTYCTEEKGPTVWPILVVQVENGTDKQVTKTNLPDVLNAIEAAIGRRLREGEVVHAMHDSPDLDVGGRLVRRVDAERIEEDKEIGVVLFKTNLSTGWDCPRAEVMMSFRRAEDHTYISQLLGRMIRSPLARRIERDAALNDVHLFLPYFDNEAIESVIKSINNPEYTPPAETGSSRTLVVLHRAPEQAEVFNAMADLVTYRVGRVRSQSGLRRYLGLTRALTQDDLDRDAIVAGRDQAVAWLEEAVAGLQSAGTFAALQTAVTQIRVRSTKVEGGAAKGHEFYTVAASDIDIDRQFDEAGRGLGFGLHVDYWTKHETRDAFDVKVEVIVAARDGAALAAIEAKATAAFDALYDHHKKAIGKLSEARRAAYERLRLATAKPTTVPWHLPDSIGYRRKPTERIWPKHLFVEDGGKFRADLKSWEHDVLEAELAKPDVVAWFRNIDRQQWSLEIAYESGGAIHPTFPDLVVVRKEKKDFHFDLLEPHDPSLGDNFEKAVGFAKFAESFGHLFGRIQMIRGRPGAGGKQEYVRLDFNRSKIRAKALLLTANPQLDALFDSDGEF